MFELIILWISLFELRQKLRIFPFTSWKKIDHTGIKETVGIIFGGLCLFFNCGAWGRLGVGFCPKPKGRLGQVGSSFEGCAVAKTSVSDSFLTP